MDSKKILISTVNLFLYLFIFTTSYCQVTTAAQWERTRKEREANEASKRQEQKLQEQQYKTNANGNTQKSSSSKSAEAYTEISKTPDANGLRKVRSYTVYGLIDKSGKEIVSPVYKDIGEFSGVFYMVSSNKPGTDYDKLWGFIDKNGIKIIPLKFDLILSDFKNGTAQVVLNNEKYFINESGGIVGEKTVYIQKKSAPETLEMDANYRIRRDKNYESAEKSEAEGKFKEAVDFYRTALSYSKEPYSKRDNEINLRIAICLINGPSFGFLRDRQGIGADVREACGYIYRYAANGGEDPKQFYYMGYLLTKELGALTDYIVSIKKVYGHADALGFYKDYETKESVTELKKTNIYEILGDNYSEKNDTAMALKYYLKQEYKADTRGDRLISKTIYLLLANKKFETAINYIKAINNFPKAKADSYNLLARAYAKMADLKNASLYIDSAFSLYMQNQISSPLYFNDTRGYIYYHLAKYNEAMVEFNKVINGGSRYPASFFYRGQIYYAQGEKQEACSDWNIAGNSSIYPGSLVTQKEIDDALGTCSKKIMKLLKD